MRAVIASGAGRYADPWHPFAETSSLIAGVLRGGGVDVDVDDDVDGAMTSLDGFDLLVVNAGDPWRSDLEHVGPSRDARQGFARALERGIGVLAMHSATASMRDYPEWAPAVGCVWLPGVSFHPPAARMSVACSDLAGVEDFSIFDERYSRLQQLGDRTVVARSDGESGPHPTAWVRTHGRSRIAVDLLGHDEQSYQSEGHRALVLALATWATASG